MRQWKYFWSFFSCENCCFNDVFKSLSLCERMEGSVMKFCCYVVKQLSVIRCLTTAGRFHYQKKWMQLTYATLIHDCFWFVVAACYCSMFHCLNWCLCAAEICFIFYYYFICFSRLGNFLYFGTKLRFFIIIQQLVLFFFQRADLVSLLENWARRDELLKQFVACLVLDAVFT